MKRTVLDDTKRLALWDWLKKMREHIERPPEPGKAPVTPADVAALGTKVLGFAVSAGNVKGALELLKIRLPGERGTFAQKLWKRLRAHDAILRRICNDLAIKAPELDDLNDGS